MNWWWMTEWVTEWMNEWLLGETLAQKSYDFSWLQIKIIYFNIISIIYIKF